MPNRHHSTFASSASTQLEASAVPVSADPLLAFSPQAFALSAARAEAALAWSPLEPGAVEGARPVEGFGAVEQPGSASARVD